MRSIIHAEYLVSIVRNTTHTVDAINKSPPLSTALDKGHLKAIANTLIHTSGDIFRRIIITHKESAIKSLEDLKGKTAMVVSYKSAGGFLAQRLFLLENGIDVFKDLRLIEGKRQEEVILNVYRKTVDVGFVRESALDVLKEEIDLSRIRILTGTPYIANWPFAATGAADERIVALVQNTLLELKDTGVFSAARITGFKQAGTGIMIPSGNG